MLSLSIFVIFKVLTVIVHSGVPMAVTPLSWRVEKYIVSFTVARAGVTLRGGKLT